METGLRSRNHVHRNVLFTQAGFVIFQAGIKSVRKVLTLQASHYVTFDGAKWDITAGCEMILATNRCFKTKNDTSDYFKVTFILSISDVVFGMVLFLVHGPWYSSIASVSC